MSQGTDARGSHIHNFKKQPARIVSLVPSQTELLFDLGLGDEVIGITKFCIHPDAWFRTKNRIGGTKTVDIEKIKQLAPDLIIANKEENIKEQVEALATYFPVWVTDVSNLKEALVMIEDIGVLTGKPEKASFLKSHIATAFGTLAANKPPRALRVCYLIWKDPYLTIGGDTFINDMLQYAGFENIFAYCKRYPEVTIKTLRSLNCELLLLSSEPYPFAEKHIPEFQAQLPGIKISLIDGELFSWYGSRLKLTPDYLVRLRAQLGNT